MIKEALKYIDSKTFFKIIFFLKDYIYHSSNNNFLEIPIELLNELNKREQTALHRLTLKIKFNRNKGKLLEEINTIINHEYLKNEKNLEKEAENILNELSENQAKITIKIPETYIEDYLTPRHFKGRPPLNKYAPSSRNAIDLNKILPKNEAFIIKGSHTLSIKASHRDEVVLHEINLENGVIIRAVIDSRKYDKYKYSKTFLSNLAFNYIVMQLNKDLK